jgi:hypothetical protein
VIAVQWFGGQYPPFSAPRLGASFLLTATKWSGVAWGGLLVLSLSPTFCVNVKRERAVFVHLTRHANIANAGTEYCMIAVLFAADFAHRHHLLY